MKSINFKIGFLKKAVANEKGSVMNISLLILLLLLLIVFASNRSSGVDSKIASNLKVYERSFYIAEGLMTQGVKVLENAKAVDEENLKDPTLFPAGLKRPVDLANDETDWTNFAVAQTWPDTAAWSGAGNPQTADRFRYMMVREGVPGGASLDPDDPVYNFIVRGRSESGGGDVLVVVGYRMQL